MSNINIEEVRYAQRTAPGAESTKELQRQYERQQNEIKATARAAERRQQEQARKEEQADLQAHLLAPRKLIPGVSLVVAGVKWAQWAGNAPAVAGGWVAVDLPGIRRCDASGSLYPPRNRVAALPESWDDESLCDIGIAEVQAVWAEECMDNDELRDAIRLLDQVSTIIEAAR